jgi:hypothetical protein
MLPEDEIRAGEEHEEQSSVGDALAEAIRREAEAVGNTIRAELRALQEEAAERGLLAAQGAGFVGAAAACGLIAAGALASLPLLALRKVIPSGAIALIVAAGAGAGAIVFGRRGLDRLKQAAPEPLEKRLDDAENSILHTLRAEVRRWRPA